MSFVEWAAQPWGEGSHHVDRLPLDPLHPLMHGTFAIAFEVQQGRIASCHFDVHANHRGDEKLLEVRTYPQGLAHINRHGWLTAPFAETLYARIIESMLGITVTARVAALRELALALNRAAVNAYWEYLEASLEGLPSEALQRREHLLAELEQLTGARMHATFVRVGGVSADVEAPQLQRLAHADDADVATAAARVAGSEGAIAVALPKVLRLPDGDAYDEIDTPHGVLGIWLVSRGDRVPLRVHLRTAGFAAFAALEQRAIGLTPQELLLALARTRSTLGEVSR